MSIETRDVPVTSEQSVESFDEAAEAFLVLLLAHGSEKVFINPGTDTFPIQEAWARRRERGLPIPEPIQCIHEHTAISAAHGYFLATGRPQTVLVHVDAGTQNAGGALHNAQRAQAGMVFCAGRAPYTWDGEMRGSKDTNIHWWQEQMDQAGIVRGFVKWHYELSRTENMAGVIERAFAVAGNEPAGPVYMTLPREVLMLPAKDVRLPGPRQTSRAVAPVPDPAALREAAAMLVKAERPLIVVGRAGRDPRSAPEIGRLAEQLGAGIVHAPEYASVPASHPLNFGPRLAEKLPQADVVLLLDPDVPWVPKQVKPAPDARVIQIDREPLHERYVIWNFPIDLRIAGSVAGALPVLRAQIEELQSDPQRQHAQARRETVAADRSAWLRNLEERARGKASQTPMDGEWVAWTLKNVLPAETILVEDTVTNRHAVQAHLQREEPGTYFSAGGSSLGWPNNAAIGVKLARPDRPVVALTGDGGFVFSNPVAALWTAAHANAPIMTVVFNNSGYNASKAPISNLYPNGAVARSNDGVVTSFDPAPDYAKIAEACGAYGVTVTEPGELESALRRALDEVQHGRSAVVNTILRKI
ncbi:MAG: thiamine pyrophosphate-requiring protein [Chloroflexi bacterium]|nr:thiamine pyrophosphate-requiring protein [Chloroflexota bacterium]